MASVGGGTTFTHHSAAHARVTSSRRYAVPGFSRAKRNSSAAESAARSIPLAAVPRTSAASSAPRALTEPASRASARSAHRREPAKSFCANARSARSSSNGRCPGAIFSADSQTLTARAGSPSSRCANPSMTKLSGVRAPALRSSFTAFLQKTTASPAASGRRAAPESARSTSAPASDRAAARRISASQGRNATCAAGSPGYPTSSKIATTAMVTMRAATVSARCGPNQAAPAQGSPGSVATTDPSSRRAVP